MAGWWETPGRGRYWVEIRKAHGIGENLYCNSRNQAGEPDSRYELVRQVRAGDVVFHYNADESRFVGRSVAYADAVVTAEEYRVTLANFEAFDLVVGLQEIRDLADDLYAVRDSLLAEYGAPLHLPFQFYEDRAGFRMLSNYFARIPEEMIEILFGGLAADVMGLVPASSEPLRRVGGFLQPFKPKRDTRYVTTLERSVQTKDRRHETLVNDCAEWLRARGFEVGRNAAVDLGVSDPPVIIEAKTVGTRWALPIREAVSQLYEYRYFEVVEPDSALVLLVEREPPTEWIDYLENDRGIGAMWPNGGSYLGSPIAAAALHL
jgi:hypothetical protein